MKHWDWYNLWTKITPKTNPGILFIDHLKIDRNAATFPPWQTILPGLCYPFPKKNWFKVWTVFTIFFSNKSWTIAIFKEENSKKFAKISKDMTGVSSLRFPNYQTSTLLGGGQKSLKQTACHRKNGGWEMTRRLNCLFVFTDEFEGICPCEFCPSDKWVAFAAKNNQHPLQRESNRYLGGDSSLHWLTFDSQKAKPK